MRVLAGCVPNSRAVIQEGLGGLIAGAMSCGDWESTSLLVGRGSLGSGLGLDR